QVRTAHRLPGVAAAGADKRRPVDHHSRRSATARLSAGAGAPSNAECGARRLRRPHPARLHWRLAGTGRHPHRAGSSVQQVRRGLGLRRGVVRGIAIMSAGSGFRRAGSTRWDATIVGAGLTGALLAVLLARGGRQVRMFERLPDMRREHIPAGRSINLALAARGIRALELAGVMEIVEPLLIPMSGRMLHETTGRLTFAPYGQGAHEVIYSISRP